MNKIIIQENKVGVAMSGGVDSSVAAALIVAEYGKENVIGLTMKLFCYSDTVKEKSCCSLDAIEDARAVCERLGVAHYVVNAEAEFEKEVINNFITEYQEGKTPNPCIRCNKLIKFDYLLKKAHEFGVDLLATGHYAQIMKEKSEYKLLKGKDESKDQSYFLYDLTQKQLEHVIFPLGAMTKIKVREIAKKYNLTTAQKKESQDICFIPNTVGEFLKTKIKAKSGNIVDNSGQILGQHDGLAYFTIGQRKGLGGGHLEPMFVIGSNRKKNELIIGPENELYKDKLVLDKVSWISDRGQDLPLGCEVRIRYQAKLTACQIQSLGEKIEVILDEPQSAITPGQSVVFYQGSEILGGGIIAA